MFFFLPKTIIWVWEYIKKQKLYPKLMITIKLAWFQRTSANQTMPKPNYNQNLSSRFHSWCWIVYKNWNKKIKPFWKYFIWKKIKQSDSQREFLSWNSNGCLLNYLKWLNQFVVSLDACPYAKNQHHSSMQSWYIADLILGVISGMPRCAWSHSYKWIESNRCFYECLTTYKKSS